MLRRVAVMLCNPLGLEAEAIEQAVARALEAGARTADLGGTYSTGEMGALIRSRLAG